MGNRHAEPARFARGLAARFEAWGGAPAPAEGPSGGEDGKQIRKRAKRDMKLRRDAERPPTSFERFRILIDIAKEGRQVVDLADHKARYALVVIGVLNAGIFFLTARGDSIATLPPAVTPWFVGFLGAYAFLTFIFVLHAIDCLRPRRLRYAELLPDARGLLGVLYWEAIASQPVEAYQKAWSEVRMGQINAELVLIMHRLSRLLQAKYAALGKLYTGLAVLVGLAVVMLVFYARFAFVT